MKEHRQPTDDSDSDSDNDDSMVSDISSVPSARIEEIHTPTAVFPTATKRKADATSEDSAEPPSKVKRLDKMKEECDPLAAAYPHLNVSIKCVFSYVKTEPSNQHKFLVSLHACNFVTDPSDPYLEVLLPLKIHIPLVGVDNTATWHDVEFNARNHPRLVSFLGYRCAWLTERS